MRTWKSFVFIRRNDSFIRRAKVSIFELQKLKNEQSNAIHIHPDEQLIM